MAQARKPYRASKLRPAHVRIQNLADPEIDSYLAALKKKFERYAMPIGEARKLIDKSMGTKTLTELLHESRQQAG